MIYMKNGKNMMNMLAIAWLLLSQNARHCETMWGPACMPHESPAGATTTLADGSARLSRPAVGELHL